MAGECIEDLSIDLLKSSDAEVTSIVSSLSLARVKRLIASLTIRLVTLCCSKCVKKIPCKLKLSKASLGPF